MADEDVVTLDKKRWSYSRTTCFGHCKYEFYLDYIVNDDEQYLSESNYFAEVGSFVHEILAKIFSKEINPCDAQQYYIDNFDNNVCYKVKKSTMEKTYQTCLDYFANTNFNWINNYKIVGVEMQVKFNIDIYNFIGYIDLLLEDINDGEIVVLDHKSAPYPLKENGDVKKNQLQSFNTYKKQMYLYCYAVHQLLGKYPKELMWNHFKDGGKIVKIPFVKDDYDESIKWFTDTIAIAEKEEIYEPSQDYFYCTQLCNFRNSCEYRKLNGGK